MYKNTVIRLAPMMGYTNAPFRLLIKLLSPSAQLFTEMVTVNAILYNPKPHYMQKFTQENNVVLQLGGSEVKPMLEVAKLAESQGFKEININCGCPSNRVLKGQFGAALMRSPELVGEMVSTIKSSTSLNVSVKHRTGLDASEDALFSFAQSCVTAGVDSLIVHARNAWLKGLNPKQNRRVPKLNIEAVRCLKQNFIDTNICINGEIKSLEVVDTYLKQGYADAIMIGRFSWDNPYFFQYLENHIMANFFLKPRYEIVSEYCEIVNSSQILKANQSVRYWLKPLVNLYHGLPGAKYWRQLVSTIQGNWHETFQAIPKSSEQLDKSLH